MLYQSGDRIEVIVRKQGGDNTPPDVAEAETEKATTSSSDDVEVGADTDSGGMSKRKKRIIKTNLTHALAITKQIADLGIEYYIGGIGYNNGDQAMQQQVSRNMEIMKDVTNVASSISMGALYGSWGGPIGAVLGATFGAVSTGVSLAVKYGGREREYNYKVFKENNAIEYSRARANINLTTGRLR